MHIIIANDMYSEVSHSATDIVYSNRIRTEIARFK